ncbi:MAG: imidazole glycerol phosphate synthase subunit HisH [Bacteroidia bacterium]|jgi:glutamine amidotransferase|nr:imidazole glycerol phosphate synthase subunit HisH [Bacteroidia bacterium]
MITIVDYGLGNIGSIVNMFKRIGVTVQIAQSPSQVIDATKLLLPGVGAFDTAMSNLKERNLLDVLNEKVLIKQTPVLGICLGMQLLTQKSEEGKLPGLNWIEGTAKRFTPTSNLKVPHMGWNRIEPQYMHPLIDHLPPEPRFYFVHSYYVQTTNREHALATTHYGHSFDSMIAHNHIWGAQFHPEKSHRFGLALLQNFAKS